MSVVAELCSLDQFRRIVRAATLAPSAENTQPWRFEIGENWLAVGVDLSRSLKSDVDHMLSLTAVGAAIENAALAASAEGFRADVCLLPEARGAARGTSPVPVARIEFTEGATPDALASQIEQRVTARRMTSRQVPADVLTELAMEVEDPTIRLHWVQEPERLEFASLVGIGNRLRFEHRAFHREFYEQARFSSADALQTRDGLEIASLQLPPGVPTLLWALRGWRRTELANRFGYSRGVGRQAAREVRGSGAIGFMTLHDATWNQFLGGGRALERVWLAATSKGLCFHPTASLSVFLAHGRREGSNLPEKQSRLVVQMCERFERLYPELNGRTVSIAFRIGYGPTPQMRSLRRDLGAVTAYRHETSSFTHWQ